MIGIVIGNYILLDKEVFKIDTNIYFDININLNNSRINYFYKYPNISLIKLLSKYTKEDIYVDNKKIDELGHFDKKVFKLFRKAIPNSVEIQYYKFNEIDKVLYDYFNDTKDFDNILNNYREKRTIIDYNSFMDEQITNFESAGRVDLEKYKYMLDTLNKLLASNIKETNWQKKLLPFIRLLFPQYIYIVDEVGFLGIKDDKRRLDYLLIDYDGNIDLIELKVPKIDLLRKNTYRDNYVESRELVGAVMQCEKYLFNLTSEKNKNESRIKKMLQEKYKIDFDVNITRPQAMIIGGRTNDFTPEQKNDFRIIKRKFSNVVDIISYDDLIDRLKRLINSVIH